MSPIKPLALALALLLYSVRCHSAVIIAGYSLPLPTILSSGGELIAGPSLSPDAPTTYVTLKARSPAVTTPSADTMALETLEPAPEHLEDDVVPPKYRCRRCFKPIGPVPVPVRVPEAPEIIHFERIYKYNGSCTPSRTPGHRIRSSGEYEGKDELRGPRPVRDVRFSRRKGLCDLCMNALGRQQNGERLSDPTLERKSGDIPQESNEEHRTMINRKGLCDCANKCLETKNQVGRCETTDIKSCGGSVSGLCECRDTADKELDKRRDRREAQLANINRSAIVIMPLDHSRPVKTALESAEEIGTAAAPARRAARTDRPYIDHELRS